MSELSVFGSDFEIKGEIGDEEVFDIALEISGFINKRVETLSPTSAEVYYIYEREIRRNFVELMLFVGAKEALIAKATDMDETVIAAYRKIFFDTTLIRGELGRTEYYEEIFSKYPQGSPEFERAEMFREAHLGGPEIVLQQFNIELDDYDTKSYKDRAAKFISWNHKKLARGDMSIDEYIPVAKATSDILVTIERATKADEAVKTSDLERLGDILQLMHENDVSVGEVDVRSYDPSKEEVIDVPLIANEENTENGDE
jgi:hypothetical protein